MNQVQCCTVANSAAWSQKDLRERWGKNMNFKFLVWIKRGDSTFIDVSFEALVFKASVTLSVNMASEPGCAKSWLE